MIDEHFGKVRETIADEPLREERDRRIPVATAEPERPRTQVRPMYAQYYGLTESPFDLTPNPRFLYLPSRHREALANLRYGLTTPKGFMLLLGEAGTGKTTLIRTVLAELAHTANRCVFVHNPTLRREEFYEYLAYEFGLAAGARVSKTRILAELQRDVEARFAAGGLTTLIIDEAQSMPDDLLEEVRLLGNLETPTSKLLNIVLSGQPELALRLNAQSLRQLKQRLALRCELAPLTADETAAYISGRLRIAGGTPRDIFTREAVVAVHANSNGIPRTVNVICENALIGGFAAQVKPVSQDIVEEVCRDFELGTSAAGPAPEPDLLSVRESSTTAPTPSISSARGLESSEDRPASPGERPMFSSVDRPTRRRFRFFS